MFFLINISLQPVSYTHLDVYKRQVTTLVDKNSYLIDYAVIISDIFHKKYAHKKEARTLLHLEYRLK